MDQAYHYARMGDPQAALDTYRRAIDSSASVEERVRAQIALADFLVEREMELSPPDAWPHLDRRLREAADKYRSAIESAHQGSAENPELLRLEVLAVNNLSTVLLRLSRPAEAIDRMSEILSKVSAEDRPRFLYNYGLCLERARRPQDALSAYLEILRGGLEVSSALERAKKLTKGKPDATLELASTLIHIGEFAEAEALLRPFTTHPEWLQIGVEPHFSTVMAIYLMEANLPPEDFQRLWRGDLESLAGAMGANSQRVAGLVAGYLAPLRSSVASRYAETAFPGWQQTSEMRQTFSAFLHAVALLYARLGQSSPALSRFSLAFAMEPANREALFYALNLLSTAPGQLDPARELLDQIVAHIQGDHHPEWLAETGATTDFYALLGDALAARVPLDGQEARRGAIVAWESALAAKASAGEPAVDESESFPAAALHRNLAQAYAELGQNDRAFHHYLVAAEEFAQEGGDLVANELLNEARGLPYQPSDSEKQQLTSLLPARTVTITAYLNPVSSDARRTVPALLQRVGQYGRNVRLKLQPQPPSGSSKISEALLCAEDQSRLWDMQAFLFKEGRELTEAEIKAEATALGLDDTFAACLDTGKYASLVQAQAQELNEIGFSGQTVLFVNGRLVGSSKAPKVMFRNLDVAVAEAAAMPP